MSIEEVTNKVSETNESIDHESSSDVRVYFGNVHYSVRKHDIVEFLVGHET